METEIGFIPDDWEIKRLSALDPRRDAIKTGPFGSLLHSYDYSNEGRPLLLVNNINGGKLVDSEYPLVNFKKADELKQFWLEEGDIVYTRVGEVGRTLYVSKEFEGWMFSGQTLRIRIRNKEVNNRFIELFLRTPIHKKIASQTALGSTRESINTSILSDTIIPLPKRDEQDEIVKTIYSLDQKIDLLRRQNETVESIAQALFKHWFLDFEFPEKNGRPYKSSGGKMVLTEEFGEVPEGWRVGKIKDFGDVVCGKTPSKLVDEYYYGNIHFIKIPDMHGNVFIIDTEDKLSEKGLDSQLGKYLPPHSINVSCIATVGLVTINSKPAHTNQQINSIIPNDETYLEYLYFSMKKLSGYLNALGSGGSATLNVNTNTFANLDVIKPPETIIKQFHEISFVFFKKIESNYYEIKNLQEVRDSLLPKLVSGKIRVTL